jgi:hypothetical protein
MTPCAPPSLAGLKYVYARPRADGTFRVLFEVPTRLRPEGWAPSIPLPIEDRRGDLTDEAEVARIRGDATRLYDDFLNKRSGCSPTAGHSIETLVRFWQNSQAYKDNKDRTNQGYQFGANICVKWAKAIGNPAVEKITVQDVEQFLGLYDDRPSQRYELRKVLRLILNEAERAGWIAVGRNPAALVLAPKPKTKARLWTAADVQRHADHYAQLGHKGIAAMILVQWEIGQRLTDAIRFRHGAEYRKGVFSFNQSKTDEPVTIPVSKACCEAIEAARVKDSIYLFHDYLTDGTVQAFVDVNRLGHVFGDNRPQGSALWLRALRHTCVVELARASCEIPEICSITGHTLASATSILQTYLPRDGKVAANAQRKRGLIAASDSNGPEKPVLSRKVRRR